MFDVQMALVCGESFLEKADISIAVILDQMGKVFKNGPSKIRSKQPLKNFTWSILEYFAQDVL